MLSFVEASNHELPFDKALLSKVEGFRANGNLANGQSRIILNKPLVNLFFDTFRISVISAFAGMTAWVLPSRKITGYAEVPGSESSS